MTQATQVLSKTAKDTGDSLQNALNVKDGTQQATGNLQSVAQQIAAVYGAATGLSGTMGKLIQTGGIAMVANTFGNLGIDFSKNNQDKNGKKSSRSNTFISCAS